MSIQNQSTKVLELEVPTLIYEKLLTLADQTGQSLSEITLRLLEQELETTDYLLSTTANRKALQKSIKQAENQEVKVFLNPKEVLDYVKNFAN
jgi:predicted CopG family antitoxin